MALAEVSRELSPQPQCLLATEVHGLLFCPHCNPSEGL